MQKIFEVFVHNSTHQAVIKNTHTNIIICRVLFNDHETDEVAINYAHLICKNLEQHFNSL